eukprot:349407-Prymnesium_polylepis.1
MLGRPGEALGAPSENTRRRTPSTKTKGQQRNVVSACCRARSGQRAPPGAWHQRPADVYCYVHCYARG